MWSERFGHDSADCCTGGSEVGNARKRQKAGVAGVTVNEWNIEDLWV